MDENEEISAEKLKELGNEAVRNQKYTEAILNYAHAIKLDPTNHVLYSNRAFAFLKIQQYYFAMEDANETIKLNPTWAKGYYRKAEIEFATYHFADAFRSYQKALQFKPDDTGIVSAMTKTLQEQQKDVRADAQIPWVGAGTGIVLGVIIVIADYLCTSKPTLTHPILMAVMTMAIAMIGYGIARTCRYYVKCQRDALLEAPIDLVKDDEPADQSDSKGESESKSPTNHARYTKSQARQRYKKGKS